jgi:excisionase family DNA binding protein
MNQDTEKLSNALAGLVATMTEIINEKLRTIGDVQEQGIARKTIEPFLTKLELAEHLGVTGRTVDNWMKKGYIPYYRIGRNIRIKLSVVEAHWDTHYRINRAGWGRGPLKARRQLQGG